MSINEYYKIIFFKRGKEKKREELIEEYKRLKRERKMKRGKRFKKFLCWV